MSDHGDMRRTRTTQPTVIAVMVSMLPLARCYPEAGAVIRQWAANAPHTRSF